MFRKSKTIKRRANENSVNWKKRNKIFNLTYWKDLLLHHNLDLTLVEKNTYGNVDGNLLDIDGKSKDNLNAWRHLENMCIRDALHLILRDDRKDILPTAYHTMSGKEKDMFWKVLYHLKVPDGYSSNISRCMNFTVS